MLKIGRGAGVVGAVVLTAAAAVWAADALATLGIPEPEAREQVMSAITVGGLPFGPASGAFKKLAPGARAAVVQDFGTWTKAYVSSPAFRTAYATYRQSQKPDVPTFQGSVDEELKQKQEEQLGSLADSRKNLAMVPAEQRKALEDMLKDAEGRIKSPDMAKMMRDGIVAERAERQRGYQESLADWQKNYPENPNPLIATRLRHFLDVSSNVDFGAQLVSRNGSTQFVNPQYESQSFEWKLCFRAGREAVAAARTFATAWLKEVDGK